MGKELKGLQLPVIAGDDKELVNYYTTLDRIFWIITVPHNCANCFGLIVFFSS
jgi:hypothetical protein